VTGNNVSIVLALKRFDDVVSKFSQLNLDWLSQAEQQHYDSFSSTIRRQQFLCGRFLARKVISYVCGGPWHAYFLSAPDDGAPRITGRSGVDELDTMSISISHTDGWVACAISKHPVGVDVQSRNKPRDVVGLSQMIDCNLSMAKSHDAKNLSHLFYANWGLREAWIKQASPVSGPSIPSFIPNHNASDRLCGLVCDIGDATLALYPARVKSIKLAPGSVQISDWVYWSAMGD